ncbi:MAG: hypothetical protein FWC85_03450 [Elusimicrobia bacterium]|nr:hypothetical protein [Elusimicrobiota bacterium]
MKKLAGLVCLLLLFGSQAAYSNIEPRGLISVDFQGTTLHTALNVLSMKTGKKLIPGGDIINKRIVLTLRDVTIEEALHALLDAYNLYYVRQGDTNIFVIRDRDDANPITVSRITFVNYARASELERVLAARLTRAGSIASDERTNALIITDLADSIDAVEGLIRTLDIPTQQVLLEARIVDVNLSRDFNVGTWVENLTRTGSNNVSSYTQWLSMPQIVGSGRLATSIVDGDWSLDAFFDIGLQTSNAKVLNNPRLLVLNNREAVIEIIEEVPFLESSTVSASTGDITGTTSFKEVGIKLRVRPQINRDGSIMLEVEPEQSFRTGETLNGVPVINTSRASTTLMLRSGETVAIGGLIREFNTTTINQIPLLGDIPLLGYLFKTRSTNSARHELTIFITARIVN